MKPTPESISKPFQRNRLMLERILTKSFLLENHLIHLHQSSTRRGDFNNTSFASLLTTRACLRTADILTRRTGISIDHAHKLPCD